VKRQWKHSVTILALAACLFGCANRPVNAPMDHVDPDHGYRFELLIPERVNNERSTLFILTFSGGGTRAAALSYGVLEELRRGKFVTADGHNRRMVDEVDVISGVSGGSFTALSYALYGERLFDEYEERFLKRNVEGALARRSFLNPANWFRIMSPHYGRSEIAADYYDQILFEGATFSDLLNKHDVPMALANGTDMTTGYRLGFSQDDFDLLCTNLGALHLSRAAAASSAVPLALSPVTFNNYGGDCGYQWPSWVVDIENRDPNLRPVGLALQRFQAMKAFDDSVERPYIHVVDGGIADNLGVRAVTEAFDERFIRSEAERDPDVPIYQNVFMIVVNAHSSPKKNWEQRESPPGFLKQLRQTSTVPIERTSMETVELMRDRIQEVAVQRQWLVDQAVLKGVTREAAEARYPLPRFEVVEVSFDKISDAGQRQYFENLPTSLHLQDEDVDKLRNIAGELLRTSPTYQKIQQAFHVDPD
jgi:NTE family protein